MTSYVPLTDRALPGLLERAGRPAPDIEKCLAIAKVLPFRVNAYVVEELIDWSSVPDDPIYQLVFPQPGMFPDGRLGHLLELTRGNAPKNVVDREVRRLRAELNPHPGGQLSLNVPTEQGEPVEGIQHKYRETVLFFPRQGQTCHAYCTYCFRWPQFVGQPEFRFASADVGALVRYIHSHPDVTSVLITGGDPLTMSSDRLRGYLETLAGVRQLESIRIGSKALSYAPGTVVDDRDADAKLRALESVTRAGKHLAFMAHYSHPRELSTGSARKAVRRVLDTGAVIRTQAPVIRHVDDSARTWAELWRDQTTLGMVPYYMFVERDTGPHDYFRVPLARAHDIYVGAQRGVGGLARTARGPIMSATPGKVCLDGVADVAGRSAFVLRFLQARDPGLVGTSFLARFDPRAGWLDELAPLDAASPFPFSSREFLSAIGAPGGPS